MRVYVKVFTKSGRNDIVEVSEKQFEVRTTAIPAKGEANEAVIKLLAKYFKTAKSNIEIVGGKTTREKIIDIKI
jgi:uncharacterized protein